jgi:lipoprotein-anchoring transpeptidase ErfK/SrfK
MTGTPLTLPVIDALFHSDEQAFVNDLRTRLQLTDEQINRLRTLAREQTAALNESDAESGSTSEARQRAVEQLRTIIGEEKVEQLAQLIATRGAGEGGETTGAPQQTAGDRPNSVPSDTRIVVNIPAFRMDVFENGRLMKSYRIGIGYPEFPLPTGLRRASTIIFNPTWTPPDEPWVSRSLRGRTVPAGSRANPLGPIKIPIGSPSLIHGGKSPARLGNFASHGCVGLTNPQVQDFARVLAQVSGTELTPERITGYARNPTQTQNVALRQPVPVELRYETIVVEDGQLYIYRDVYERGTNTEENLRRVLAAFDVTLEQLSEEERTRVMEALRDMSRDARGRSTANANNTNANSTNNANRNSRNQNNRSVTTTVRGERQVAIPIAALQGKGYPAPANLDTGGGAARSSAGGRASRRR